MPQLNNSEFSELKRPVLSHMARTLYVFYLQPEAVQKEIIVDPVALTSCLVSVSKSAPCAPNIKDVEAALDELEEVGLIEREGSKSKSKSKGNSNNNNQSAATEPSSWQNVKITLPLLVGVLDQVPERPFAMYVTWQPGPSFKDAALLAGLVDYTYKESELRSFVSYWMTTTVERNQFAWERAFVQRLIKVHSAAEIAERSYFQNRNAPLRSRYRNLPAQFQMNTSLPSGMSIPNTSLTSHATHAPYTPQEPFSTDKLSFGDSLSNTYNSSLNTDTGTVTSADAGDVSSMTPQVGAYHTGVNTPPRNQKGTRIKTLKGVSTNTDEYELIAPSYSDLQDHMSTDPMRAGYEPMGVAPGYTDPQIRAAMEANRNLNPLLSGREPLSAAPNYTPPNPMTVETGVDMGHNSNEPERLPRFHADELPSWAQHSNDGRGGRGGSSSSSTINSNNSYGRFYGTYGVGNGEGTFAGSVTGTNADASLPPYDYGTMRDPEMKSQSVNTIAAQAVAGAQSLGFGQEQGSNLSPDRNRDLQSLLPSTKPVFTTIGESSGAGAAKQATSTTTGPNSTAYRPLDRKKLGIDSN